MFGANEYVIAYISSTAPIATNQRAMPQTATAVSPRPIDAEDVLREPARRGRRETSETIASVIAASVHAMSVSLCLTKLRVSRDAVDGVQRAARAAERARRAVERDEDAEQEREAHRAAGVLDRRRQRCAAARR